MSTNQMMVKRGDEYNRMMQGELKVTCQVTGFSKNRRVVYAKSQAAGVPVSLPNTAYYKPVCAKNGYRAVLSFDRFDTPGEEIGKGTRVHAICQHVDGHGLVAVRWCAEEEFQDCELKVDEICDAIERDRVAAELAEVALRAELERLAEKFRVAKIAADAARELELTKNPPTYDEAIARGWRVVPGGNGRQRILEHEFDGKTKRITKHLPPSKGVPTKKAIPSPRELVGV